MIRRIQQWRKRRASVKRWAKRRATLRYNYSKPVEISGPVEPKDGFWEEVMQQTGFPDRDRAAAARKPETDIVTIWEEGRAALVRMHSISKGEIAHLAQKAAEERWHG